MTPLDLILAALTIYLALGALFAIPFALRGAARIDPVARAASLPFKLMILPGAALLWPALALMWARAPRGSSA